ncbi:helix-turn-helix domain-containing protein [Xenophilus sp.]|uniref:helix-turn-helix domain-containing protein n=1 Tax=Xenophilus sp. TaxID=1873499 RepID=UPI0037DD0062
MKDANEKPQGRANDRGAKRNTNESLDRTAILRSKSTTGTAQRERILAALRSGPKTSYDLRRLGCYQAPARVKELRDRLGYEIETQRVTLTDGYGYTHANAALYTLRGEPQEAV